MLSGVPAERHDAVVARITRSGKLLTRISNNLRDPFKVTDGGLGLSGIRSVLSGVTIASRRARIRAPVHSAPPPSPHGWGLAFRPQTCPRQAARG